MTNPSDHQQAYPSRQLATKIAVGDLSEDQAQMIAARRLDDLSDKLCRTQSLSWVKKLIRPPQPVMGLYLYGGVGRGKTMLMDMFVNSLPYHETAPTVWRLHFHDFMVLAQDNIHAARQADDDDPIEAAAQMLAARGQVICFDEMEVRDIADAMILARLFSSLLARGITVVATSNRHADDLYKDGLHRDRFLPFIELLKSRCDMVELGVGMDWRSTVLASIPTWYHPLNVVTKSALDSAFRHVTDRKPVTAKPFGWRGVISPSRRWQVISVLPVLPVCVMRRWQRAIIWPLPDDLPAWCLPIYRNLLKAMNIWRGGLCG